MPNLVLCQVSKNYYQPSACAYIYYGSTTAPKDHKGQEIAKDGEMPMVLVDHLQTHVLPELQKQLSRTAYQATEIDFANMEPRPFVSIQRRDGRPVSDVDLQSIKSILENALNKMNEQSSKLHCHRLFTTKMDNDVENGDEVEHKMRAIKKPKRK